MPLPEQTVSVVDELKKRGFTPTAGERLPLYGARESLYKQSGLESALGSFTGTSAQNLKLLEYIRNNDVKPQAVGQAPTLPIVPAGDVLTQDQANKMTGINFQQPGTATNALNVAGNQPNRFPTADELGIPKVRTSEDIMKDIGTIRGTTAEDVLATARGGLEASAAQREGAEALAAGEIAATAKAEQFGSRGLYFSGARVSAEGAERATALSKKLAIDEGLARFIIQQQEQGDKETASRIEEIVKDAVSNDKAARSEAITALSALGYVVMPSGQIIQKPSEIRAREAEARAAAKALEPEASPAIQKEYEYALSQGYTGSFMDYQKFKATQFGTEGVGEIAPSPGFANNKVESSFREDLVALRADKTKTPVENYDTLRTLYSPQEVSDEAIKNVLGIKEELPSPEGIADSWVNESTDFGLSGLKPGQYTPSTKKKSEPELKFNFLPGVFNK